MPIEANWNHNYKKDCLPNFSLNMDLPRHRWYEFKEGFGSKLVERAITEMRNIIKKEDIVVADPFSGSGTTPLTALENNCNTVAMEVNPFMNYVGRTKCIKKICNEKQYIDELKWIMNQEPKERDSYLEEKSTFTNRKGKVKWLFNRSVLRGYESLYNYIMNTENSDLFLLALLSAAMQCCNAKRDGKCLRYKKNWDTLAYSSHELRTIFHQNSMDIMSDIISLPLLNGERIFYEGDTRKIIKNIENKIVNLIVFSPPYLNSFDYSDIYRPELYLGGYVKNNIELREIRKITIRSHVQCKWNTTDKSKSLWAQGIATKISERKDNLWDKSIPQMINAYFYDMEEVLKEAYRIATDSAQMWFVVSTSAYAGVEIPVDLILADIATKQGWTLLNVNALRTLRTSSQCVDDEQSKIRLRESLVICKK